ncbi:sigma factor, partial [uncultured Ruthenibacterium sp.]|uniref:sigma factor n=1 Tax=uncultured Ruthenibacterium sp. TaxID=1905347 RepID=UPI00349EBC28
MNLREKIYKIWRVLQSKWMIGIRLPDYLYYINGPEVLPPPLTKEEERIVFAGLEQGNPDSRDLLIVHNLRLVVYIARKFESKTASAEDLISIGTIGLIKAVNTFVPSKNI